MNTQEPIVVMTYQEKIWYDFIESNPELVMWAYGILAVGLLIWIICVFFAPRPKKNWW
jgi:hypothetical protein